MLQMIMKGLFYTDWLSLIRRSQLQIIIRLFCRGRSGVQDNERADKLAGDAVTGDSMTFDPPIVLAVVKDDLHSRRPESASYTLHLLQEKKV